MDEVKVDIVKLLELSSLATSAEILLKRVQKLKLDGVIACDIDDYLFSAKSFKQRYRNESVKKEKQIAR